MNKRTNKRTKLYTRENLVKTWQSLKTLRAQWFKREKRKEKKRKEKERPVAKKSNWAREIFSSKISLVN